MYCISGDIRADDHEVGRLPVSRKQNNPKNGPQRLRSDSAVLSSRSSTALINSRSLSHERINVPDDSPLSVSSLNSQVPIRLGDSLHTAPFARLNPGRCVSFKTAVALRGCVCVRGKQARRKGRQQHLAVRRLLCPANSNRPLS